MPGTQPITTPDTKSAPADGCIVIIAFGAGEFGRSLLVEHSKHLYIRRLLYDKKAVDE
ncbi:MAG: hypothetical protein JRE64_05205 [Deltaproteobacteria bacterium]|nr:hypothetical protein [Deltaproteobacteria bacterium]